jgi:hypothetical protein
VKTHSTSDRPSCQARTACGADSLPYCAIHRGCSVPFSGAGLVAWQWTLEGQKLKGIFLQHMLFGCLSTLLIRIVFWIDFRVRHHAEEFLPKYRLPIEAIAVLHLGLTGHLGGFSQ